MDVGNCLLSIQPAFIAFVWRTGHHKGVCFNARGCVHLVSLLTRMRELINVFNIPGYCIFWVQNKECFWWVYREAFTMI